METLPSEAVMNSAEQTGKVQTVLGPIDPDELRITLTHEHLLIDMDCYFEMPAEASERAWVDAPVTIDRLGGLSRRLHVRENNKLVDERTAVEEALRYKHAGGSSLVDATSIGIARDPLALARISRATGLNVIMGSSYYVPVSHPPDMDRRTEEQIADEIVGDIRTGVGDTGIRAGVIGEVGNFWPSSDNERKVLRASAQAQVETGAPILIHCGFHPDSPPQIMEWLIDAGARPENVIMGHIDIFPDRGWIRNLVETGCYLEYDAFSVEDTTLADVADQRIDMTSDVQRLEILEFLLEQGYEDRIVIAQDVCFKFHYTRYGGKGYAHILDSIVPRMRKRGFTDGQINAILVENPKRALTFA